MDPTATSALQDNAVPNTVGVELRLITAEPVANRHSEPVRAAALLLPHPEVAAAHRRMALALAPTAIPAHQAFAAPNGAGVEQEMITAVLGARVDLESVNNQTKKDGVGRLADGVMCFGDVIDNVARPLCSFTLPLVHSLKIE